MLIRKFQISDKVYKDQRISPKGKLAYCYIYSKGFDRYVVDINVGELQKTVRITNGELRECLEKLEQLQYLVFKEYNTGMYQIKVC